ncbi:MAG: crotonase/enoyl-CoA hydratase family protein, partial [Myxococcota bacterium]|nr:crotonase/enoyl-CoA hydratase family protein [Myxococcota bacterium]
MSDRVKIDFHAGVADVRLNRADKMNALDHAMMKGLVEAGRQLANEPKVRVAVLSGEGRAFCAGLDMASMAAIGNAPKKSADQTQEGAAEQKGAGLLARSPDSPANFAQQVAWIWRELPIPVIAAVHGVAYGGGLQLALGADMRYVTPDARMSVMEIKWGLIPDMSGTQTLRHLVRDDVARELTYTGRVVSGEEAVDLGLATRVADDPRAIALETAQEIASKSPSAIRAGKELLNQSTLISVEEGLRLEASLQTDLIGGE